MDHVFDFSKLEAGHLEIMAVHTAVSKLIGDIVESFKVTNTNKSLEIRSHAEGLPALMLDPQHAGQILFNLIGNAVKFTKSGYIEVRATFAPDGDGASGTLRLEVEDTGCGIAEADLDHIMSPYEQVISKEARNGGTGLGLPICYEMVRQMGGNITINGGSVTASGGSSGAGIGGWSNGSSRTTITITGGNVVATGGEKAAGIGSGDDLCCNINISGGAGTATKGAGAECSIGRAFFVTDYDDPYTHPCGTISISGIVGVGVSTYQHECTSETCTWQNSNP